ncbi:MAG: glycosyltransferase, partial [Bryobacteraceae bacterium]
APDVARARGARVIPMGRNAGFAPAVNRGIRESRGDWIAVLNTDVELVPDYFATLLASAQAKGAWFATGKILDPGRTGVVDGAFDVVCRGGAAWRAGHGRADGPRFSMERRIWSAPWTAALFRAELFQRIGLLEESFESYLEDVDFGLRCALAEYSGLYIPQAVAWHRGSAALGRWSAETVRLIARNQVWLLARHYPGSSLRRNWRPVLAAHCLWGALALRHGAPAAWLHGQWQGWRGWRRARAARVSWTEMRLDALLRENERAIYELQAPDGLDRFWKMYFLLAGAGAR